LLIPSIDLLGGRIVSLVQGEKKSLEFDDFEPWIKRFEKYPLVHNVDLDAAMGQGSNRKLVEQLMTRLPRTQVGGGLRTVEQAQEILKLGAKRVVIGSALFEDKEINLGFAQRAAANIDPKQLVFAVDAKGGRVAVSGWKVSTAVTAVDAMKALEPYCGSFVYTHIDNEGMMMGFPPDVARELRSATKHQLMLAGGIRSMDEVAQFDAMECDCIVGMAIYRGDIQA
jgi:phosphoribosylformimino-5-aminoimidazole carboxamide ribotide isomerase